MYWATLIGMGLGALIGHGNPLAIILGAVIGYHFDKGFKQKANPIKSADVGQVQQLFFHNTFQFMGHLAKADGVVSEREIQIARVLMQQLNLSASQREQAIALFRTGRDASREQIERDLMALQRVLYHPDYIDLIQMFLEIQIQVACIDGDLDAAEMQLLQKACAILKFPAHLLQLLIARTMAEFNFHQSKAGAGQQSSSHYNPAQQLQQAYGVLGVTAQTPWPDVKKAYRKLMNQHHPDKLVAKGLPQQMIEIAKQKTQEIQSAYDLIDQHRNKS